MRPELSHEIEVIPQFCEIDPMEVVWHGHYVRYMEAARSALLAQYQYGYAQMRASGFAWPVVDMRIKYVEPAALGQPLRVRATIVEWESRLRIEYLMRDARSGRKINQGHTIQVAVDMARRQMLYACPPVLGQRLGVTP